MSIQQQTASGIEQLLESWMPRLRMLEMDQVRHKPAPDRWSLVEVFGHLVDSACNNHQRFVRAQYCESLEFPKYEQNEWVTSAGYADAEWGCVIELWYQYNLQLAHLIRRVDTDQLSTVCTILPYEPCTLEFLIVDYLDHLKHHLNIVESRVASADAG